MSAGKYRNNYRKLIALDLVIINNIYNRLGTTIYLTVDSSRPYYYRVTVGKDGNTVAVGNGREVYGALEALAIGLRLLELSPNICKVQTETA